MSEVRTRICLWRVLLLLGVCSAVVLAGSTGVAGLVHSRRAVPPATFSSYVDVTATPAYPFETPRYQEQQAVVLSFVVADRTNACRPSWGGYYSLDEAAGALELDRRVAQLRSTGGHVAVSFGGQRNDELAVACHSARDLRSAYQQVIDRYQLDTIDLDVEGAELTDEAAAARRATAIAAAQAAQKARHKALAVWLTLPVTPNGLTTEGTVQVSTLRSAGVELAGVNAMAMDFGGARQAGQSLLQAVQSSGAAMIDQVSALYPRTSRPSGPQHVGLTVMIGQNDVTDERFTIDDARALNTWARTTGVGRLSMWSLNRDATCAYPLPVTLTVVQTGCSGVDQKGLSFASELGKDLAAVAQASATPRLSPTPSASASQPHPDVTDDPATSPDPIWDPLGQYPGGTKVVWRHQVWRAAFWTSGEAPGSTVHPSGADPWVLLGPVLPGDRPGPLPSLAAGTYPQWNPTTAYVSGARVQLGLVPYEAKWWSRGQKPATVVAGGNPWVLVNPPAPGSVQ